MTLNPTTTAQVLAIADRDARNWEPMISGTQNEAENGVRWIVRRIHASVEVIIDLGKGKVTKHILEMPEEWVAPI
jgi:hypothetical protein